MNELLRMTYEEIVEHNDNQIIIQSDTSGTYLITEKNWDWEFSGYLEDFSDKKLLDNWTIKGEFHYLTSFNGEFKEILNELKAENGE